MLSIKLKLSYLLQLSFIHNFLWPQFSVEWIKRNTQRNCRRSQQNYLLQIPLIDDDLCWSIFINSCHHIWPHTAHNFFSFYSLFIQLLHCSLLFVKIKLVEGMDGSRLWIRRILKSFRIFVTNLSFSDKMLTNYSKMMRKKSWFDVISKKIFLKNRYFSNFKSEISVKNSNFSQKA